MQATVIPARALTPDHLSTWATIQAANSQLANPFFCAAFTTLVASVRNDIYVGILTLDGQIIGFFPFQQQSRRHARPVGGLLSDYQGVILAPEQSIVPSELLAACGLTQWDFDHLITAQTEFEPYCQVATCSSILDLSQGFAAYNAQQRQKGSNDYKSLGRKQRKLSREVGPLRYESHVPDAKMLELLFAWKSEQYIRTGIIDIFGFDWIRILLEKIHALQTPAFAGQLSVLYAGDEVVAIHFCLTSPTVWHSWFPAYDTRFYRYSPGLLLLMAMAEDAAGKGVLVLDLGKGSESYKSLVSNHRIPIMEGRVALPSLSGYLQSWKTRTANFVRRTPLVIPARIPGRLWRRYQTYRKFL